MQGCEYVGRPIRKEESQRPPHITKGGSEDMRLICAFNPPVTGRETQDSDGAYEFT